MITILQSSSFPHQRFVPIQPIRVFHSSPYAGYNGPLDPFDSYEDYVVRSRARPSLEELAFAAQQGSYARQLPSQCCQQPFAQSLLHEAQLQALRERASQQQALRERAAHQEALRQVPLQQHVLRQRRAQQQALRQRAAQQQALRDLALQRQQQQQVSALRREQEQFVARTRAAMIGESQQGLVADNAKLRRKLAEQSQLVSNLNELLQQVLREAEENKPVDGAPLKRVPAVRRNTKPAEPASDVAKSVPTSATAKPEENHKSVPQDRTAQLHEYLASAAVKIQRHWRDHITHLHSLEQLGSLSSRINKLVDSFILPSSLEFSSTTAPTLGFTPSNAPVRAYEEALTTILQELDSVQSGGDVEIRNERKELVHRVERELAILEASVRSVWDGRKKEEVKESSVEAVAVPSEPNTVVDEKEATAGEMAESAVEAQPTAAPSTAFADKSVDTVSSPIHDSSAEAKVDADAIKDVDIEVTKTALADLLGHDIVANESSTPASDELPADAPLDDLPTATPSQSNEDPHLAEFLGVYHADTSAKYESDHVEETATVFSATPAFDHDGVASDSMTDSEVTVQGLVEKVEGTKDNEADHVHFTTTSSYPPSVTSKASRSSTPAPSNKSITSSPLLEGAFVALPATEAVDEEAGGDVLEGSSTESGSNTEDERHDDGFELL